MHIFERTSEFVFYEADHECTLSMMFSEDEMGVECAPIVLNDKLDPDAEW